MASHAWLRIAVTTARAVLYAIAALLGLIALLLVPSTTISQDRILPLNG